MGFAKPGFPQRSYILYNKSRPCTKIIRSGGVKVKLQLHYTAMWVRIMAGRKKDFSKNIRKNKIFFGGHPGKTRFFIIQYIAHTYNILYAACRKTQNTRFLKKDQKIMKKSVDKGEMAWYYKQAPKRAATTKRTESFGARSLMRGCETGETVKKKHFVN